MRPFTIPALLACLSLTGCFAPAEEASDIVGSGQTTTLRVTTRAAVGEITYPVRVLAYDDAGELCGEQELHSASDAISLQLQEGRYHLTALSGQGQYVEPKSYARKSSAVGIPSGGYASQPLMMGGADVLLSGGSASVSLVLSYRVAGLALSLADVPADVTAVTVGVSQQYGAIDMSGALSGNSAATVSCHKQDGLWCSDQVYLMPGVGSTTTLTLSLTSPEQQVSYNYQLAEALQAAVPYKISGSYVESSAPYITGILTAEGWQEERSISFDFGVGQSGGSVPSSIPTVSVTSLPSPCSVWEGHLVALVENASATEADLLLLSLADYDGVYAPGAAGHATEMADVANAYAEDALTSWSVPTEEQVRTLRTAYAGAFDALNDQITRLGGFPIEVYSTSQNARYLCAEGTKTYNWAKSGSVTTAGTSVKYRLRLVKVVHARVK